jgi:hypothetical protein
MTPLAHRLAQLPLAAVAAHWERLDLDRASDAELIAAAVSQLAAPIRAVTSSFQLHAPLELLARAALLPRVEPRAREPARQRIAEIVVRFVAETEPAPRPARAFHATARAGDALLDAVTTGDADAADAALAYLLDHEPASATFARLRPGLVDHLGAAAHAPIFLVEARRVLDRVPQVAALLHPLLRSLTETGDRLTWHRHPGGAARAPSIDRGSLAERRLTDRLLAPRRTESASSFIAATMLAVERAGLAADLIGDLWHRIASVRAEVLLSRLAAWSMLQDVPDHAPYGWTHTLTLPQAVLQMTHGTADSPAAVAVAATYVLGFRATLGTVALDPAAALPPPPLPTPGARITQLATAAALHRDAHFAKYVLACFDASARDPSATDLYLAAAERLASYWHARSASTTAAT